MLHQLRLRSSGIKSQRLGTPDIGDLFYSFVLLETVSSWNVERVVLDAVGDTEVWAWVLGSVSQVSRSV